MQVIGCNVHAKLSRHLKLERYIKVSSRERMKKKEVKGRKKRTLVGMKTFGIHFGNFGNFRHLI